MNAEDAKRRAGDRGKGLPRPEAFVSVKWDNAVEVPIER
jgi:hypothetical protein